jgi:hypothetical protein
MLGGQEQGWFRSNLRAGPPEDLVGEFDKLGEVGVLVDLAGDASSGGTSLGSWVNTSVLQGGEGSL